MWVTELVYFILDTGPTNEAHLIFATIRIPSLANDWFKATETFPNRLIVTRVMFGVNTGNSKQGLRCKSCKMATHLWCSSELSQQPCNGKVRLFAPSSDCYTLRLIEWWHTISLEVSEIPRFKYFTIIKHYSITSSVYLSCFALYCHHLPTALLDVAKNSCHLVNYLSIWCVLA